MKRIVDYIYNIPKFSRKCTLENTKKMLALLGNPGMDSKIIHVAGTNGKGSVCAYTDSILRQCGHTVGMFTSPHLVKINERIRINGNDVTDEEFMDAFYAVLKVTQKMLEEGYMHPSFFEFLFGMAMYSFGKNKTEYIILETGLGGRLDATNAVDNVALSVITSISLDHTDILGDTYTKIAEEKAGIIKKNTPVLFMNKREDVADVIVQKIVEYDLDFYSVSPKEITNVSKTDKYIDFSLSNEYYCNEHFSICSNGYYQTENAALALMAVNILGIKDMDAIRLGLKNAGWIGRMQEIDNNMVLDGAHNEDGIARFIESVKADNYTKGRYLLFSAVKDKHYEDMIKVISESELFDGVIIVPLEDERGLKVAEMEKLFNEYFGGEIIPMENISQGIFQACMLRDEGYRIYIAGSLYLAGEVLALRQ